MTSEWDDYDNFRIADRSMSHGSFKSESEDMDNQRRCNKANVPYQYSANYLVKSNNTTKHIPVTDWRHPLNKNTKQIKTIKFFEVIMTLKI